MSSTKAVHTIISGRVQGVWYRAWTVEQATSRRLTGWVRNRDDGTVEAVFAGPSDQVDAMVEACREGPPHARVAGIAVKPVSDPGLKEFEQRSSR